MRFIADLHIHSRYSRATSKDLDFPHLYTWALNKGIQVVGTGDFTHPKWCEEIELYLEEEADSNLFVLKEEYKKISLPGVASEYDIRFLLTTEISCIYKRHGKTRKVHHVVLAPNWKVAQEIRWKLAKIGNIESDGRPILGLDSYDLLYLLLEISPDIILIPAHIWTPWFSLFGSKSGFDTMEECFAELSSHIYALETGLSSDPAMNWMCSQLDKYLLVSNSDAHSPSKLGRESNIFDCDITAESIFHALRTGQGFCGTMEFYPEEGKYHLDGHRKCQVRMSPEETLQQNGICPVCGKPVTLGVLYRVLELADRKFGERPENALPYSSIIPLESILSEIFEVGGSSKKVQQEYFRLLKLFGSELDILQNVDLEILEKKNSAIFAEAIRRVRQGNIVLQGGYDGEFGIVKIFENSEKKEFLPCLFVEGIGNISNQKEKALPKSKNIKNISKQEEKELPKNKKVVYDHTSEILQKKNKQEKQIDQLTENIYDELNEEQKQVVQYAGSPMIVIAGPGTGKTRTLVARIAYQIAQKNVVGEHILAVTFTNRAALEMQERLSKVDGGSNVFIGTFHGFCMEILREFHEKVGLPHDFLLFDHNMFHIKFNKKDLEKISLCKSECLQPHEVQEKDIREVYIEYEQLLQDNGVVDIDDLIVKTVRLLEEHSEVQEILQNRFRMILVDEYQDINFAQYRLLRLLINDTTDFLAIGDADQSIYGFRGSRIEYFLHFFQDFPNAVRFSLQKNYRSTIPILTAAQHVIQKNKERMACPLHTDREGALVRRYVAESEYDEAHFIVNEIEKLLGGTSHRFFEANRQENIEYSFRNFAVFYRTNKQNEVLQEVFQKSSLPYHLVGESSIWNVNDLQFWKSLVAITLQWQSPFAWKRVFLHYDPALADNIVDAMVQVNFDIDILQKSPLWSHMKDCMEALVQLQKIDIKEGAWDWFQSAICYFPWKKLQKNSQEVLTEVFSKYKNLQNVLQHFLLKEQLDDYDPRIEKVALMSLHASKGLEFPVVFITGCEEKLIPFQYGNEISLEKEEERRLFYVGMTRAKDLLYLTHSNRRMMFGLQYNSPSPYFNDIPEEFIEMYGMKNKKTKKKATSSQNLLF